MACQNFDQNKKDCTCKDLKCPRHGICCECIRYHRGHGGKPACLKKMTAIIAVPD